MARSSSPAASASAAAAAAATSPCSSPFGTESSQDLPYPVSSPKCDQLFNIFHPADPISYRLEPLVSKAMAQLKPQPLPYTKRGLFSSNGQIVGGISGIGQSVTKSVSNMWTSFSAGIASSILNRSLGITAADSPSSVSSSLASPATGGSASNAFVPREGQHPPTMIDAELETLYAGFRRKQTEEGRDRHPGTGDGGGGQVGGIGRDERRVKREEDKVRALNRTGRIDFSIQEGVFDLSVIASIASHLSYWGDDVCSSPPRPLLISETEFLGCQPLHREPAVESEQGDEKDQGKQGERSGRWVEYWADRVNHTGHGSCVGGHV